MGAENWSSVDGFFLVVFSDLPQLQGPLFIILLLSYLITLVGNLLVMVTIYCNSHLYTPMYFFLSNLSFIDICHTSNILPQMLARFFQEEAHMSMSECLLQMEFFLALMFTEILVLTVMAYDRYVAICNPLRYMTIMNKDVCMQLAVGSWTVGIMFPLTYIALSSVLIFCGSHTINHFFCDLPALMKLTCSSTRQIEMLIYVLGSMITLGSITLIITSYINITSCILKIKSKGGRHKAFSTCASHLTVVLLFYGSACSSYFRPTSTYSMKENKMLSLLYIVVTPMCNPIIYSLKNEEFKKGLRKFNMFQMVAE
uniref:Olfactory receptor n=1 Tax=Ambystoma tigrinum TaxID=8305 RepID=Q90X10_AMBTI|nr:olfactory receptor [Ambystoma tigrinum]